MKLIKIKPTDSLEIVSTIIDQECVDVGAKILYDKYLNPKIRPFTVRQTFDLVSLPSKVSFLITSDSNKPFKSRAR